MGGVSVEYPSLLCSRIPGTARYASRPLRRDDSAAWPSATSDLALARSTRANLLVVGSDRVVANLVSLAAPDVRPEFVILCRDGQLRLPPASSRPATVVVRDVDALTTEEQGKLLEWLEATGSRTQVVSTTSVALLPLVHARAFNDALYYRLNTIYIDLAA
jgi:hypothetical protein